MKKIINRKKYDTSTAKEICSRGYYNNGNYCATDTLYQKKTGEFFMCHSTNGNDLFDRTDYIEPLDESGAKKFAEENMDADDYEAVFGVVGE